MPRPSAVTTLELSRWQLQTVLDGLWHIEGGLRGAGLDGSDPRLVETIELRATVEKKIKELERADR